MQSMYCVGLDLHKKTISYCVKDASGRIRSEGTIPATRVDLDRWMKTLPQPWTAATPNCRRSCARSAAPRATKPAADARPFASVTSILPRGSNMLLRGSHAPRNRDFGMWDRDRKPHSENPVSQDLSRSFSGTHSLARLHSSDCGHNFGQERR